MSRENQNAEYRDRGAAMVPGNRRGRRMRSMNPALTRSFHGQMIIVVAAATAVLVGAIALAADVSVLYYNQMLLQKAADAAVIAGAGYLPSQADKAVSTTNSYASNNGVKQGEIVSTLVSGDSQSITIRVQRTVPHYFARIFGFTNAQVSAIATAGVPNAVNTVNVNGSGNYGSTVGEYGVLPIAVDYNTPYTRNQAVTLNNVQIGPGFWGSVSLGSPGGSTLRQNIANGYDGEIKVGDWILTAGGIKTGPIDQGFSDRLAAAQNSDPSGTFNSHAFTNPRVVTVPMVDWSNVNGSSEIPVKGFAELWIDSSSNGTINAHFIEQVVPDSTGAPGTPSWGAAGMPILLG